jgi:hypothetical protein
MIEAVHVVICPLLGLLLFVISGLAVTSRSGPLSVLMGRTVTYMLLTASAFFANGEYKLD